MTRRLCCFVLASAAGFAGCCHTRDCGYVASAPPPGVSPCNPCGPAHPLPPRLAPAPPPGTAPPGAVVVPPGAIGSVPPSPGAIGSVPPGVPDGAAPPSHPGPGVQLAPPEPLNPERPGESSARLYPPQTAEPPVASGPPAASIPPGVRERQESAPSPPAGIPQFALARAKVANGLKPFTDGITWLKAHGYRTVLYVHGPGDDTAAARRLFVDRGLSFLSLEVAPESLSKEVVDRFNRLVTDENNLPLFVYDKDSALTGGLWYLYYRLVEGATDERARAEALRLGFSADQDAEHRTMWLAVQNFLKNQNR